MAVEKKKNAHKQTSKNKNPSRVFTELLNRLTVQTSGERVTDNTDSKIDIQNKIHFLILEKEVLKYH